jgi:hypothetical protein
MRPTFVQRFRRTWVLCRNNLPDSVILVSPAFCDWCDFNQGFYL